jgi:hypothetical protein
MSCKAMYEEGFPNIQSVEMRKYLAIHIWRPLVIYDFATNPF